MRKLLVCIMFTCLSSLCSLCYSQVISGTVIDKYTRDPIIGANVIGSQSRKSTVTDVSGKFSLELKDDPSIFISFVGYDDNKVNITSATTYQIEMVASYLNQVVVVAYGTQKKENLTGAVSSVDVTRTFTGKPLNDPTRALQGVVPGLTIQYGNGGLVAPPEIKIRGIGSVNGTSRPLVLVDNVQTDDLSIINPQDIESVSVLKDAASASIYGARAAFGVVLIRTKNGRKNQKATVSYSNNFAWNKATIMPDFADPVDELQALHDAGVRAGTSSPETFGMNLLKLRDGIINWKNNYAGKNGHEMVKGEDWNVEADGRTYFYKVWDPKAEILNKFTRSELHNINIAGGSEKLSYYLSAGYSKDGGIIKMNPDLVKKYNITAGITASVNKWLDVNVKTMYRNFEYQYPFEYQNYWYFFWRWGSYFPYGTNQGSYFRTNSAYLDAASKSKIVDNYQRIDLGATIKINENLNVRADYTIVRDNAIRQEAGGPVVAWDYWTAGALNLTDIAQSQNIVNYTTGRAMINTLNAYATYQNSFGEDYHLKVTAGVNAEDNENINFFAARRGLLDPTQAELGLTYGDQTSGPSSFNVPPGWSQAGHGKKAFAGYFARVNYDYKNIYLLELNGRYDGSSFFPPQERWAFFPSVSGGYRISRENFMSFMKPLVNDLKLRASFGQLGNQDVTSNGTNIYLRAMNGSTQNAAPYPVNWLNNTGLWAASVTQPSASARSLEWERVTTFDIGADVRVLDNHIGLSFDWYERNTKGMIQATSVPAVFGVGGPFINAGNFRTRGYEVTLDAQTRINNDAKVYANLSLNDYQTVFTKWENPNLSISNGTGIHYVGKTFGEIWGFQTDGFFTSADDVAKSPSQKALQSGNFVFGPGDIRYADLNGDGKIDGGKMTVADHGDLKVIGNTQPRYLYSARIGGNWKDFDIDIFIQGVGKRNWWGIGNTVLPLYQSLDIIYANQMDYWTPDNPNAKYPRPYPNNQIGTIGGLANGTNNFYPQTKYLLNLSYCRLKNVTIGYAMPASLLSRYKIQKLRIYLSGQNLAELSNVGVPLDPEITDGGLNFTGRTYPFMRSYSFGVQLSF